MDVTGEKVRSGVPVRKTIFRVSKMDCPAEEQLIRMKLEGMDHIHSLHFDIGNRRLEIYHEESYEGLLKALETLHLDTTFLSSGPAESSEIDHKDHGERRVLWQVLAINLFFFVLEIVTGFIARSMGLVADSLDMLADAIVYGLALLAVGGSPLRKKRIAVAAGYFQLVLGLLGFAEVMRRFIGHEEAPGFQLMILISVFALAGNAICLNLLQKAGSREAHMQASMIFTSTDVLVNAGVIVAGVFVYLTGSKLPDLIVGTAVFVLVVWGARRILRISR
jgi:Co/Zn/Cd efflux system component